MSYTAAEQRAALIALAALRRDSVALTRQLYDDTDVEEVRHATAVALGFLAGLVSAGRYGNIARARHQLGKVAGPKYAARGVK